MFRLVLRRPPCRLVLHPLQPLQPLISQKRCSWRQLHTTGWALKDEGDKKSDNEPIEKPGEPVNKTPIESEPSISSEASQSRRAIQPPKKQNASENVSKHDTDLWTRFEQFFGRIMSGQNFQNLQTELLKFNDNRLKKPVDPNDAEKPISVKLKEYVKELKTSIGLASQVVNDVTGYTKVNDLKHKILDNEEELGRLREEIIAAKAVYTKSVEARSASQKEMNELLERKNNWTDEDLKRFTKLYMSDHLLDKSVEESRAVLKKLELKEEQKQEQVMQNILLRYHEEQVWSDKIRQFSTWATILIMLANLGLVFLVQLVFEPFKRWRLVNSFEKKTKEMFEKNQEMGKQLGELSLRFDKAEADYKESERRIVASVEANEQLVVQELPQYKADARLLPTELSWAGFTSWLSQVFGQMLSPFYGSGAETYTLTKHDLQTFFYLVALASSTASLWIAKKL